MDDDPIVAAMRIAEEGRSRQEFDLQPSATPFKDAIDNVGKDGEGLDLQVGIDGKHDAGVKLEGNKYLGKGWTVGGAVQWAKNTGAAAWGALKWSPKSK